MSLKKATTYRSFQWGQLLAILLSHIKLVILSALSHLTVSGPIRLFERGPVQKIFANFKYNSFYDRRYGFTNVFSKHVLAREKESQMEGIY